MYVHFALWKVYDIIIKESVCFKKYNLRGFIMCLSKTGYTLLITSKLSLIQRKISINDVGDINKVTTK